MDFRLLRHLYYFVTVAEELHFGRAARRLGITQPPLSAQIKVLEKSLGTELFERNNTSVRLTQEGQAILPLVQSVIKQAGRLEGLVRAAKAGATSTITVGATTSFMLGPLGEAIQIATKDLPGLKVNVLEMKSSEAIAAVRDREVDIGMVWGDQFSPPLSHFALEKIRLVLACRHDHPLATKPLVTFQDVVGQSIILCDRRDGPSFADSIQKAFHDYGITLQIEHEVRSIQSQVAMVLCGGGLALIPESAQHYRTTSVVFRHFNENIRIATPSVIWHSERNTAALGEFLDILKRF